MARINKRYKYEIAPQCNPEAVVRGEKYRFTVLTPSIIRMEYNENGIFEDRATQVIINRNLEVPKFTVKKDGNTIKIFTEHIELTYHTQYPFCESSLTARFYGEWGANTHTWRYKNTTVPYGGKVQNYWGTIRALDDFDGPVPLEKGLMGPTFTEWDDSKSMIIADDGWFEERPDDAIDIYIFAYGFRHTALLDDFLKISGKLPMLPRYALGNWWSRYYAYTDNEYKALMEKFEERNIPFSVACLDMDWHITDIDTQYGTGWSGYTWNKELFPDHKAFLKWLKERNYRVMLNIHDREGVTPYEDGYLEMAKRLGNIDTKNGQKINFDFGTPEFIEAYFECLRHKSEDEGVDFWWYDGFPENMSAFVKADMPFMINHFNYIDTERNGNRGMLLSRRSGMGGHRYGIGFSGDTKPTWEMLDFQPYFTSTASNVGFGWWSHDIGGFMNGIRDDELMVRWEQFGAFSPINRIHCTNNPFMSKEPWNFNEIAEKVLVRFMQLRHELIPYIYTMNYKCWADNITLVRPLYYYEPNHGCPNEYFFGDDLVVAPITSPSDKATLMGKTRMFMPKGVWFDFFNGRKYAGERNYTVYRDIYNIPVFARAGAIIPQAVINGSNDISNPKHLKLDIFPEDNGKFVLYEDDGISLKYKQGDCTTTEMLWDWSKNPVFTIKKPVGNLEHIPNKRDYTLRFRKVNNCKEIAVTVGGKAVEYTAEYKDETLIITVTDVDAQLKIKFLQDVYTLSNDYRKEVDELLMKMQMSNADKWHISKLMHREENPSIVLHEINLEEKYDINVRGALTEILLAEGTF
ncbi:MAG: DUF5110 domain-containing protein [Ruminococcaceae bacterium]|nr:DUF5110 domain-containing protein [Oscillospiraceae bacterium]